MPFVQQNVNFDGKRNSIVSCSELGELDFSAWRVGTPPVTTPAPTTSTSPNEPGTTVKPTGEPIDGPGDGDNVNHAEVACRLADRRTKLMACGGRDNPWGNEHLKALLSWMQQKNGVRNQNCG